MSEETMDEISLEARWASRCEAVAVWWEMHGLDAFGELVSPLRGEDVWRQSKLGDVVEEARRWRELGANKAARIVHDHDLSPAQREMVKMCSSARVLAALIGAGCGSGKREQRDLQRAKKFVRVLRECNKMGRGMELAALFPGTGPFAQIGSLAWDKLAKRSWKWGKVQRVGNWALAGVAGSVWGADWAGVAAAASGGALSLMVQALCVAWLAGRAAGLFGLSLSVEPLIEMAMAFEPRMDTSAVRGQLANVINKKEVGFLVAPKEEALSEMDALVDAMMWNLPGHVFMDYARSEDDLLATASAPVLACEESEAISKAAGAGSARGKARSL